MKIFRIIIICLLPAFFAGYAGAAELITKGRSNCVIVISPDSSAQLNEAAKELQNFLFQITGARVPVITPAQPCQGMVKICVGENILTRNAGYKMPRFRNSGYDIVIGKDLIILNGPLFRNSADKALLSHPSLHSRNLYQTLSIKEKNQEEYADFGPMYAVSAFLEHLGVRFYAPGKNGTFVPRKKDIRLKEKRITREAAFAVRRYTYSPDREVDPELRRHLKFLKSGSSLPPAGVFALAPILREGGKNNPSWLACREDGTPYEASEPGGYPRFSDPSLRQKCWEELKKYISARPFLKEVLILPPVSFEEHIHFADEEKFKRREYSMSYRRDIPAAFYLFLARKTAESFPGVRLLYRSVNNQLPDPALLKKFPTSLAGIPATVGVTAYAYPRAAQYYLDSAEKFVRGTSGEKCMIREFWNEYDAPALPRRGFYLAQTLQKVRQKQKGFVKGFLFDLPFDPATGSLAVPEQMHFLLYINSKLLWDPETDMDQLLQEYCHHLFGPAAGEMRLFFREAEKSLCRSYMRGLSPYLAPQLQRDADLLRTLLERAVSKTVPGSIFRKRIEKIRSGHSWMQKDLFADWNRKNKPQTGIIISRDTPLNGDLSKYKKWYTLSCDDRSAPRTEAAFALNENRRNLFAAFRCYEPQMKKLSSGARKHDAPEISREDHVVIRINTAAGGEYTLQVNSAGVILDSCTAPGVLQHTGSSLNWGSSRNSAKVRRYPDRWEVELSMVSCGRPPVPGSRFPWKIQLGRSRFISGKEQKYHLSETGGAGKRCDFYFPLKDSEGREVNGRYTTVMIPLPGIPNGLQYSILPKKTPEIGFSAADWSGKSWKHIKEARLGNNLCFLRRSSRYLPDARFKLQYDREKLYVFYKVREKGIRAAHHKDQEMVCRDSCMEFFFRPGGDKGQHYLNFEMNCVGTLLLAQIKILPRNRIKMNMLPLEDLKKIKRHCSLKKFTGEIKKETVWYAGLEIPWELVTKYTSEPPPTKGTVWSGNIYKCADWSRFPHYLTWKATDSFHAPASFGKFIFE